MNHSENKRTPSLGGWFIAAGMGLVAAAVAKVVGDLTYSQSGFIGIGIFVLAGLILGLYWGPAAATPAKAVTTDARTAPAPAPAAVPAPTMAAPMMAPVTPPAMAEAVPTPAAVMSAPVAEPAPAKAARAAKPAAAAAKPKTAAKPAAKTGPAKAVVAKAPKAAKVKKPDGPLRLSAPRKGKADDLKEIEGIGPALEKLCNELGFYHFDQIAGWSDADVAWVDANMKTFKGRIMRDKWIAQSKIIITEGLDAFRVRAQTNNY